MYHVCIVCCNFLLLTKKEKLYEPLTFFLGGGLATPLQICSIILLHAIQLIQSCSLTMLYKIGYHRAEQSKVDQHPFVGVEIEKNPQTENMWKYQ